ncbi:MAG: CHAP domain-containing protein [Bdellovibrio sp.]|nr:CHAP domain-containing protein [Bdellovibrio sp.]
MKCRILAISFIALVTGCGRSFSTNQANSGFEQTDLQNLPSGPVSGPEQVPTTFELPEVTDTSVSSPGADVTALPEPTVTPTASAPKIIPITPKGLPLTPAKEAPKAKPGNIFTKTWDLILNAQKTIELEARSIGTACNKYVARVLELSGFPKGYFTANDFDSYAKKNISHYKVVDFARDGNGSEEARLKQHIWSYPEKTPFVMQWSRIGGYGHIAIVERIGENLIIYQASLNQYVARKDQTTVHILLNGYNRRVLSVYSELNP